MIVVWSDQDSEWSASRLSSDRYNQVLEKLLQQKSPEAIYVISNKKEHMTHITLAVTGSISLLKAADITSQLTKLGFSEILMTPAAREFILLAHEILSNIK